MSRLGAVCAVGFAAGSALAQWNAWDGCVTPPPDQTAPISADATTTDPILLVDQIFPFGDQGGISVFVGLSGDYTFGPMTPCGGFINNSTLEIAGSLNFVSVLGSQISTDDDFYTITPGIINNVNTDPPPPPPFVNEVGGRRYSYVSIRSQTIDGGTVEDGLFGENGFELVVAPGASNRYLRLQDNGMAGGVDAEMRVESRGTGLRFQWTLRNTNAEARLIGLRYNGFMHMRSGGEAAFGGFLGKIPFFLTPKGRPTILDTMWDRAATPSTFPKFFNIYYAQSYPYPSLRFITDKDAAHPDQSKMTRFAVGGETTGTLWNFTIIPDVYHSGVMAFWYDPVLVQPGQSRTIVFYVEGSYSTGDVQKPYPIFTEANPLLEYFPGGTNELNPNPARVIATVDNWFAQANHELPIAQMDLSIRLLRSDTNPPDPLLPTTSPLSLSGGDPVTKQLFNILPRELQNVEWAVEASGLEPGVFPYRIDVSSNVGPAKKVYGTVTVGLTPRVDLKPYPYTGGAAQLLSFPWEFANSNLGALGFPGGSQYFTYDAASGQYVAAAQAERGRAFWVKYAGDPAPFSLNGASSANDKTVGGFNVVLERGWNLVGNPYPYPVQLNQIDGVCDADPTQVYTWTEMASRNWVRSTWFRQNPDPASPDTYVFSSDDSQLILPGVGYWIYVVSYEQVQLYWPAVFLPGLSNSFWVQSNGSTQTIDKWQLPMRVAGSGYQYGSVAVGYNSDPSQAEASTALVPPAKPGGNPLELTLVRSSLGVNTRFAVDTRSGSSNQTYKMDVKIPRLGSYTLTWPEARSLPRGVRIRVKDLQNGRIVDVRSVGSYTFTATGTTPRRFEITASAE
jgi:hypothetical protein